MATVSHCHTHFQERGCGYHGYCLNFGFAVCLYSTADKPKLYQLQCLQSKQRRVKITQTVAVKWEDVALYRQHCTLKAMYYRTFDMTHTSSV